MAYQITMFSAFELLPYASKRYLSSLVVQCSIFTLWIVSHVRFTVNLPLKLHSNIAQLTMKREIQRPQRSGSPWATHDNSESHFCQQTTDFSNSPCLRAVYSASKWLHIHIPCLWSSQLRWAMKPQQKLKKPKRVTNSSCKAYGRHRLASYVRKLCNGRVY